MPPHLVYLLSELMCEQLLDKVCLPIFEAELSSQEFRRVVIMHYDGLCLTFCHLNRYLKNLHL